MCIILGSFNTKALFSHLSRWLVLLVDNLLGWFAGDSSAGSYGRDQTNGEGVLVTGKDFSGSVTVSLTYIYYNINLLSNIKTKVLFFLPKNAVKKYKNLN